MTMCTPRTATVFAAGTSSYGVSDLAMLAGDTHKFESQYLFKLVGGTPEEVPDIYEARSPVKQAKHIKSPLLVSVVVGGL
jgi:dipeptidyl aminopeptidase/acylaminoacyl peptidase